MVLNVAYTGSGDRYHVKGRVTEAGYAGAALLEPMGSPTRHWFPAGSYLQYRDTDHLVELLETVDEEKIASCAKLFSAIVREKYSAAAFYGRMLEAINVAHPLA
jgi:hypothetical protein